jgi:flavorubredoxin
MIPREIKPGVTAVGVQHWDRRLFDELIPLPEGTSYNAYLIEGSGKTALVDTVETSKGNLLIENLSKLGVKQLDYVITNHAEQDHSGATPLVLKHYPMAKVVTNQKCKEMLMDAMMIPDDKFIVVKDKETLSLGSKTLEFIFAPWVHWPETMLTYLKEDYILFPCDLFGSHLATSYLYVTNEPLVYRAAKRYYAEIMMPFRNHIKKHMETLKSYKIDVIAASHGPIYNKPEFIMSAYRDWISDDVKNEVVIPYVSMYGDTKKMVEHLIDCLVKRGITVKPFDIPRTDIGELAMELVDAATIVIGSPTVLAGAHPTIVTAVYLANAIRPKARFATVIGSFGWGGKMVDQIVSMVPNLKVEVLEPVMAKGHPRDNDFKSIEKLADTIAQKHKELKLV